MKSMIAFAFAAFAAVALGDTVQDWYTPDKWDVSQINTDFTYANRKFECRLEYNSATKKWEYNDNLPVANADTSTAISEALWGQKLARDNTSRIEKLANSVYNNSVTSFKVDANTGRLGIYGKDINGVDVWKSDFPELGYKLKMTTMSGYSGVVGLFYNNSPVDDSSGIPFVMQAGNDSSIEEKYSSTKNCWYHQLLGWDDPSSHHALDDLSTSMQAQQKTIAQNYQLIARSSTGGLNYVDLGTLTAGGSSGQAADNDTITTNAVGFVGKSALYGFHSDSTETGAIPARGTDGKLAWVNPGDIEGSILVSQSGSVPAYSGTSTAGRYYGTPKPAESAVLDTTSLGWYELPNVTTNYVQGDERTTTTAEATVGEETCKVVKLIAEPTGDAIADGYPIYGARMALPPGATEPTMVWERIVGASVAPTIPDRVTLTNKLDGTIAINGFAAAADGSLLARKSATEVEWRSSVVNARNGVAVTSEGTTPFIEIQHFSDTPSNTLSGATSNRILSRNVNGEIEMLDVTFPVSINAINGRGDIEVRSDTQYPNTVKIIGLEQCGLSGQYVQRVDANGRFVFGEVNDVIEETIGSMTAANIRELVDDVYVARSGDTMTGELKVQAALTATDAKFNSVTSDYAVVHNDARFEGAVAADTLTVTNLCNLPWANSVMITIGEDEGAPIRQGLGDHIAFATADAVTSATNAMAQAWSVGQLTTTGTTELNAATTIGGKAAVLVDDPPVGQPKIVSMRIENGKLVITDADGIERRFTPDSP